MAMHALHAPYQNQLRGLEELNEKTHAWVLLYSTLRQLLLNSEGT